MHAIRFQTQCRLLHWKQWRCMGLVGSGNESTVWTSLHIQKDLFLFVGLRVLSHVNETQVGTTETLKGSGLDWFS